MKTNENLMKFFFLFVKENNKTKTKNGSVRRETFPRFCTEVTYLAELPTSTSETNIPGTVGVILINIVQFYLPFVGYYCFTIMNRI